MVYRDFLNIFCYKDNNEVKIAVVCMLFSQESVKVRNNRK